MIPCQTSSPYGLDDHGGDAPFLYVPLEHEGDEGTPRAKLDQSSVAPGNLHRVDVLAPTGQPLNVQGFKVGKALA